MGWPRFIPRLVVPVLLLQMLLPAKMALAADNSGGGQDFALKTVSAHTVALGSYRPSFPNDLSALDQVDGITGKREGIIAWYALWGGWKSSFNRADLDAVSRRGATPLITWEPWSGTNADPNWSLQSAILSGRSDGYIDSWARGMADYGKPVLLRFAHEMHDQVYPWAAGINGNTPADYVAAWKHVHSIFAKYNTANVKWVWNPNTTGDAKAATYEATYRSLYPGDDNVDFLGLDIYNTGPALDWGAPRWRTFSQAMTEPYKAITAISGKPVLLPEVGSAETGGDKGSWIKDLVTALPAFPQVVSVVWFDVNKEQAWSLQSSPNTFQAWTSAARDARFGPLDPSFLS